jgi:steroid delta-isomerase-like uncharacterized protein
MSDANKALVHRVIDELWNARRTELIDEIYAADFIVRNPDGDLHGPDGYRELYTRYTEAFPDAQLHLDGEIVAEGDTVATPYVFTGTHRGDLMGIAPTGRKVSVKGTTIFHIKNGRMIEERAVWDTAALLQQLGVIPT